MAHFITFPDAVGCAAAPAARDNGIVIGTRGIATGTSGRATGGCVVDDGQISGIMAQEARNTAGLIALPTIDELVTDAVAADFHDRVSCYAPIETVAATAARIAIEDWCHDNHAPISAIPYDIWFGLIVALVREARAEIVRCIDEESRGWVDLVEGMASGDLDADGHWVPYQKSYFGGVA